MRRSTMTIGLVLAIALSGGVSGAARAGIYTDDLSKCLVKATSAADRTSFIVWIYELLSAHPAVSSLSKVTDADRAAANKAAAGLMQRLLLEDCRAQTVDAMKYEGSGALQQSFSVLGQVAMSGLTQDPAVAKNMMDMVGDIDMSKFQALGKEAGVLQAPPKK
jgi:hypothetical protein